MKSNLMALRILGGLLLIAALAGCGSPASTPTPAPTVDLQPTISAIQTQAVSTMIVNLTRSAPTVTPTLAATPTPASTATSTPAPTNTPLPSPTATATFKPWTLTPSATLSPYRCTITEFSPALNTSFDANTDFDARWTIKNTGDQPLLANEVDIVYVSGTKLQESGSGIDLKSDIAVGGTFTAVIDMRSPAGSGTYSTIWAVTRGSDTLCTMGLTIVVK